jgi:hypothetical protein
MKHSLSLSEKNLWGYDSTKAKVTKDFWRAPNNRSRIAIFAVIVARDDIRAGHVPSVILNQAYSKKVI